MRIVKKEFQVFKSLLSFKYQHFVLISCYATNLLEKQNFCGFVEEKLPHKLMENIENKLDKINYCHLGKKIDLCPEINEKYVNLFEF